MSAITIKISTDNAAFDPDAGRGHEVARILRDLANSYEEMEDIEFRKTIYDINGNHVGQATYRR